METAIDTTRHPAPAAGALIDLGAVKARQRTMWGSGDYGVIAATLQIVAERLCEAVDLRGGERVLDVATGTGNGAIAAARRWAHVVGIDYVPALLQRGRERAAAERLGVEFHEGDAEAIPFPEASFDVVLSSFGVMFAPDQERAAQELVRVCRPGGRIGLANWTPDGFIGEMFRVVGRHVPPPPGVRPPALWGTEPRIRELFGEAAREIAIVKRHFAFRYASAPHFVDVFRRWYGPTLQAFAALDLKRQAGLAGDLEALLERHHQGGAGLVVPGEYLEIVVTRA
jgi:SAM-dependent methyltransferase